MIYKTSKEWTEAAKERAAQAFNGLFGLLYHVCFMGIVSGLIYVGKQIEAFYRRETVAGVIISVLMTLVLLGWLVTFVAERAEAVKHEHRADSLSYELSKYRQSYEGDKVVIGEDTVTIDYYGK